MAVRSHGIWSRGADREIHADLKIQTFARADGLDWCAHAHAALVDPATRKVLVRDGVAVMVERDGTRIVPPGELLEVPDDVAVERGWLWQDGAFAPPPAPAPLDAVTKLRAFFDANPDVRALLG